LLEDPPTRDALLQMLRRMAATGEKEGIFAPPSRRGSDPPGRGSHWYLSVAYSGGDLLCVLLLSEDSFLDSGDILQAAKQSRFREHLRRYLLITLPVLGIGSLWILLLAARGRRLGLVREEGDEA